MQILLHGTQLPPRNGAQQPPHFSVHVYFGPSLLWSNGRPFQQLLSSCYNMFIINCSVCYQQENLGKSWAVTVSPTLPSRTEIQLRPLSFCIQNLKKSKSICSKRCKICNKSVVAIIAIQMHQTRFKCESKTMFQIFARTFYLILTCILIHQLKLLVSFKFFTVNSAIRYKVCHRRLLLHCTRLRIKCRKPFSWCDLKTFLC